MNTQDEERQNDLIIHDGFAVLNDFRSSAGIKRDHQKEVVVPELLPRYPFASYAKALAFPSDSLRTSFLNDCSLVFTARTREDSESYSTGETFFLPCLMKPRCALEALALTIFHAHVDGVEKEYANAAEQTSNGRVVGPILYDPETSGVEWWTLVLDTASVKTPKDLQRQTIDDEDEDDEVGMHFDADYGLEAQMKGFMLHPRVATITYLSDIGVPTLILERRSPAQSDVKKSLDGDIKKGWLSHPSFGKHVAFDGRLLHGAPGAYFPAVSGSSEIIEPSVDPAIPARKKVKIDHNIIIDKATSLSNKRITFLANIWLNHCPIDADTLNEEIIDKLTTVWGDDTSSNSTITPFNWILEDVTIPDILGEGTTLTKANTQSDTPAGTEEDLVICNRHVVMTYGASMKDFHHVSQSAAKAGSLAINIEEGVLTLEVGEQVTDDEEQDADEE